MLKKEKDNLRDRKLGPNWKEYRPFIVRKMIAKSAIDNPARA